MTAMSSRTNCPPLSCPPRFGTARSPDRPTLGGAVALTAAKLGKPFMLWQRLVADVVMEIDPATGRLAYSELGLTVPRQSGKSTWVLAKSTHRGSATKFFGPRQHVVYTAQTRLKAREKWEEDFLTELQGSAAFRSRVSVHLANGNEHMRFVNGSRFGLEAGTEKAGHGGTLDEAYIDEAFAQPDWRLEQAFGPAMITRANKLLAWISTAGWLGASPYLQDKVEIGRAAVEEGRTRGICYFEWSAPEEADPADPRTWRACMPALGHTIDEDAILAEYEKARDAGKLNDFERAYLNRWVRKESAGRSALDLNAWGRNADPGSQIASKVAIGFSIAQDLSRAAVAVSGRRADGLGHLELVDYRDGTGWLLGRLTELVKRWKPCAVVLNPSSAGASAEKDLIELGVKPKPGPGEYRLQVTGGREYAQACVALARDVADDRLRHMGAEPLDDAARAAVRRKLADSWAFGPAPDADESVMCPLEAVTLARHGFMTHGLSEPPDPFVLFGK
jgi:hypothetical protein